MFSRIILLVVSVPWPWYIPNCAGEQRGHDTNKARVGVVFSE